MTHRPRAERWRITRVLQDLGYSSLEEWCGDNPLPDSAPACCSELCNVELDGYCEHGHPSIVIAAGLI